MTTATITSGTTSAPTAPLRAGWFTQTGQVFRRWIIGTWRQAWGPVMSLLQPIIWIVLFGQVFSSLGALPAFGGAGYIDYLVPGVLMMTVLYSGAWAGTGFIDDMNSGVMDQLLTAPISRVGDHLGAAAAAAHRSTPSQSLIVLGIGWLAGARYPGGIGGIAGRARRRDAAGDDLLLRLVGRRADDAQPGRADRPVADDRAAGDVPVDHDDARRPAAGVDAERRRLEPADLGGRARPRRARRLARLGRRGGSGGAAARPRGARLRVGRAPASGPTSARCSAVRGSPFVARAPVLVARKRQTGAEARQASSMRPVSAFS